MNTNESLTRRAFVGIAAGALFVRPSRVYRLQAIAAARMPHTLTVRSSDPRFAAHFNAGGIFELREYTSRKRWFHFDSLEQRDRAWTSFNVAHKTLRRGPRSIALYRPISS